MIKLLSVLVLSTVFFSSLVVAGGHSKGKTAFLWERTFHMKPGVSPPEAIQAVGKALAFVNKNYPEVNVVMSVPLQGPQNRVKVFYIRDSVDASMMSRGKVFRDPGFQPHIANIGKYFSVFEDEWWMAPPQGINYTVNK